MVYLLKIVIFQFAMLVITLANYQLQVLISMAVFFGSHE